MKTDQQIKISIADKFKQYRKENRLTQGNFADMLHISRPTLGSYEERRAMPPLAVLMTFAELCQVTVDDIIN